MENPKRKSNYTKEDLVKYSRYRKNLKFKNMEKVWKAIQEEKVDSYEEHEEYREPLAITTEQEIKIQLSWGGDGDGFLIKVDENGDAVSGKYYWEDWGVYEEVELSIPEVDAVVDMYLYGDPTIISENN